MRYSFLKTAYTYTRFDEDIDGVDWLHGTNASFRTEIAQRAGMWDATVTTQDEHSFAFKLGRVLRRNEYLGFRTAPVVLRRLDIPGGMDKRSVRLEAELSSHLAFIYRIVRTYYPLRFKCAYPLYLAWVVGRTFLWIWDRTRRGVSVSGRLRDSFKLFVRFLPALVHEHQVANASTRASSR